MRVAGGDGLVQPLGGVEEVAGGKAPDFAAFDGELAQTVELEVDVPLGEDEVGVDAEESAEQRPGRGFLDVALKVGQGLAEEGFDAVPEGVGRVVGQCVSFTGDGSAPD
ncbi:hypothetical protein [Streptomyces sp. NPDC048340]|uniref:hypothetical protein n=1 Tax=Streptomyces sp. NPDC048340 TaxID=3365537 RepID=UPI0037218951